MSAIFGILDFQGRPIEPEWIKSIQMDLAHRGPDGEGLYQEPGVALGHKLLQVTPESVYDTSPYEEDGFVITANARLDERESIMDRLGISQTDREIITDPLLLLRSFRKFGKGFVKDIYGDFAFAIWDKAKKELFCARDQMGVKPFLYYYQDGRLAFSSELKSLVKLPFVETEIDCLVLRDDAIGLYDLPNKTAWKNIIRLQAAHHLTFNQGIFRKERYWDLEAKENPNLKTEEQSAQMLRELLIKVIEDHTRVQGTVGIPLSGGLDSSTIACIAARKFAKQNKTIVTASSVLHPTRDRGEFQDEMEYINEVLHQEPNIDPTFVYHTDLEFLKELDSKFEKHYAPVVYSHYVDDALNSQFEKKEVRRVLSGTLGDMTTSNSTILPLPNLLIQGKFKTYYSLSKRYRENMRLPFWSHLRRNVVQPMIPIYIQDFFYFLLGKNTPWEISEFPLSLNKMDQRIVSRRMKLMYENYYMATFKIQNNIWSTDFENFGEGWDCGPSHFQLEYTYPLLDRRIVEFLVQVPVAHFYAGGLKRGLIRKAMLGILPEKIRLRMNKLPYSPADELIYNRDLSKIQFLLKGEEFQRVVNDFFDIVKLNLTIEVILSSKKSRNFLPIYWSTISVSVLTKYIHWATFLNNSTNEKSNEKAVEQT